MANKNTRIARKKGFCSMSDMMRNGNKIVKGTCVDSGSNGLRKPKVYPKFK